jgi:aminoglycoside/choline kinase family phosphotransferase
LNKEEALELANKTGFNAIEVDVLKLEASGREYYRLHFDKAASLVMCYLDPKKGNHNKFLHVSNFFTSLSINSPEIILADQATGVIFQQDLGDKCLIDMELNKNPELLKQSVEILSTIQRAHIPQIDKLDEESLMMQMETIQSIFLEKFLSCQKLKELEILQSRALSKLSEQPWMNCHFDFERRNLMVDSNHKIAVIDFQDLCIGPVGIDLAGIIVDHYISYSDKLINNALKYYIESSQLDVSVKDVFEWLRWGAIQRNMRILGTLSNLYIQDNKTFRLKDLPGILENLITLIPNDEFMSLKEHLSSAVMPKLHEELEAL